MTVGERMRATRKARGISAEKVAEALGVSPATIYRYEKGDIEKVPGDVLEPLSRALGTTPAYLMGWEADPDVDTALLAEISDRSRSGCFDAEDKMFSTFGAEKGTLSLRMAGNKFAVLFYHPFDSRDSSGRAMEILGMLRDLSQDELLAVAGMLRGFVNRKDLED